MNGVKVKKTEQELRSDVVSAAKSLYSKGLNSTLSGNVSARVDEKTMLLTPTGSTGILKGNIHEDQLSVVNFEGELIRGPKQSSEWKVHASIYKAMPEINAIVHPHPIHSILFVMNNVHYDNTVNEINEIIPPIFMKFGEARYYLGKTDSSNSNEFYIGLTRGVSGSQELADNVLSEIKQKKVSLVIMEGHGTIAIGSNMAEALGRAEQLEYYAEISNLKKLNR